MRRADSEPQIKSEGPTTAAEPSSRRGAHRVRTFGDKFIDVARLQRAWEMTQGIGLPERLDTRLAASLYPGRAGAFQRRSIREKAGALGAGKSTASGADRLAPVSHRRRRTSSNPCETLAIGQITA